MSIHVELAIGRGKRRNRAIAASFASTVVSRRLTSLDREDLPRRVAERSGRDYGAADGLRRTLRLKDYQQARRANSAASLPVTFDLGCTGAVKDFWAAVTTLYGRATEISAIGRARPPNPAYGRL